MRYMGGLRTKMPITFWTFVIGGAALAGFPFITAGFWSKDEILLDTFVHAPVIFGILATAALLTAFYTTRQVVMTFFGAPRTESAKHAHESHWTMTVPLMVLSFFAITAGWVNIPADFPVLGPLVKSLHVEAWFKHMLVGALIEKPEGPEFTPIPLITSLVVGLGGIALGYFVYRNAYKKADDADPLQGPLGPIYLLLKNKYYIDTGKTRMPDGQYVNNLYQTWFVDPVVWVSENFTAKVLDQQVIDGFLHFVAGLAPRLGRLFRDYFDTPVINEFFGDGTAWIFQRLGREGRVIQTGRVQEYLLALLAAIILFGIVLSTMPLR
jgi:NADH-quinone oxidoreductase subunit L